MLIFFFLPAGFLLPPGAEAGEIIGGHEAKPHSRPHMAYLAIKREDKQYSTCGGSLVTTNFVLTAAHCNGDEIVVLLGAHNPEEDEESQQMIEVLKHFPHPDYDDHSYNNDIMLLQLNESAKLNEWVKTINLTNTNDIVKPGTMCSVAGWGLTKACDAESASDTLQEVDVEVQENDACEIYKNYNSCTMLCAGDPTEGKDAGQGDSGGPLVCEGIIKGIVSWGPCCPPGVYTRLSTFIPWIQEILKKPQP